MPKKISIRTFSNIPSKVVSALRFIIFTVNEIIEYPFLVYSLRSLDCEVKIVQIEALPTKLFISTALGLLYYDNGKVNRLIGGHFYGLTHTSGRWYAFRRYSAKLSGREQGQILSFRFEDSKPVGIRVEKNNLDPQIHQIDFWGDHLYITDTKNNRILRYKIGKHGLMDEMVKYPKGIAIHGKASDNYAHLNSIYRVSGDIYVLCHNKTSKTGRNSALLRLDEELRVLEEISLEAGDAHNFAVFQGEKLFCDSKNRLLHWGSDKLVCGYFVRGLAISDSFVLAGGTEPTEEKENRYKASGMIFAFRTKDKKLIAKISMPEVGAVYELRLVATKDFGMST